MPTLRHDGKFINLCMIGTNSPGPGPGPSPIFYNEEPTLVEYADSTSASLDIVGEATRTNLSGWANVKRVLFGNTVSAIANGLFRNSSNLKYAYTGWNCQTVGERSFNDCSIRDVVFGPGIGVIGTGQYAFSGSTSLSSMTFHPDSQLSAVGYGAVRATALKELSVCSDSSSLAFGQWSFSNNQNLSALVLDVQTVPSLDYSPIASPRGVLDACPHLTSTSYDGSIVVPDALKDSFLSNGRWSDIPSSKFVTMSEWTSEIPERSFITSCFYNSQLIWGGGEETKPNPLSALYRRWTFDTLSDEVAGVPMTLFGNAHLDNGSLVINGNGEMRTNYAQLSGNNWPLSSETGATVEMWVTPTSFAWWQRTWCAGDGSGTNLTEYLRFSSTNTMMGAANGPQGDVLSTTLPILSANVMQHVAIVYDMSRENTTLTLYQFSPGGAVLRSTGAGQSTLSSYWSGSDVWYLGRTMYYEWNDADFDGSMQEFRVWNRPLTYDEIVACDEAGPDEMPDWTPKPPVPVPLSALYRHWTFDTPSDEVANVPVQLFGNSYLENGALVLNGNGSTNATYAQLSGNNFPTEYDGGITIELWQNTSTRRNWTRIYDFGTNNNNYTFMTTTAGSTNTARAAVKCGSGESYVDSTYMTPGQRWHAAVVYDLTSESGKTLVTVYTFDPNGTMTTSSTTMNQDMANAMTSWNINYLGRSFYQDADFTGSIYDFKIWSTMLSEEQLRALDTAGPDALLQ